MDPKNTSSISFLESANIVCPQYRIISSFIFEQNDKEQFRYIYNCHEMKMNQVSQIVANNWSAWGPWLWTDKKRGNVNFLNRQTVDCGQDGYLTSFKTENNHDEGNIRYKYKCAKSRGSNVKNICFERTTKKEDSEDFFLPSLCFHHIKCNENEGLVKFQLHVDYDERKGHVWYEYSCCRLY